MSLQTPLQIGSVLKVHFPEHAPPGHEQTGSRPAIVIANPAAIDKQRFSTLVVVPTTSQDGTWSEKNKIYPLLPKGAGGLTVESVVLLDQIRALDIKRLLHADTRYLGQLSQLQIGLILKGLKTLFGFK